MTIKRPKERYVTLKKGGITWDVWLEFSKDFGVVRSDNFKKAQIFIDSEVLRLSDPLIPKRSASLIRSGQIHTVMGSGEVRYVTPYARYHYYGKLMVDPKYQKGAFYSVDYGFWSRPNVKKQLTNITMNYSGAPNRGAKWFERMKSKYKNTIMKGAEEIAKGKR